jgi:hypothetical protein
VNEEGPKYVVKLLLLHVLKDCCVVDFISISKPVKTLPLLETISNANPVIFPAEMPAD